MFGMGFFEILLIAVIAIIALGPEKLPGAMVDVAKFLKKFKSGVEDAKSTLDNELNISEMREEANKYKAQLEDVKSSVSLNNMDLGVGDLLKDDFANDEVKPKKDEKVSFETQNKTENKEPKIEKKTVETKSQKVEEVVVDVEKKPSPADKFKVQQNEENS